MKKDLNKINFNATHNAYENAWIYDKAFEQIDYSDDFNLEVFKASIYFKNLEKLLIEKIKIADVIVGCVAWFTNENIINALSKKSGVSIIVQKEGFLRRDHNSSSQNWQVKLKKNYSKLPALNLPYKTAPQAPFLSSDFLYTGKLQNGLEPVRCVGMFDKNKKINLPRMHHKFIVFCREEKSLLLDDFESEEICSLEPYAVWTGSYNFTKNSNFSFENAIYMEEKIVAEKYFAEWGQIATLSEILDWKQEYINPEALFE